MMKNKKTKNVFYKRKLSTLFLLVIFVFIILFVSIMMASLISYFIEDAGFLSSFIADRPIHIFRFMGFMILISLLIGTILAVIGGDYLLRPLQRLTDATKQIASGNFDVRIEDVRGSKELELLTKSFNEMAKELSSIETFRTDFVNNISHEFKTPVVSIKGFAHRLKKSNLTEAQRNEYLDIIISESERLTRLSSNVLLLSSLESMERCMEKSSYFLDEQLRNVLLLFEPQFQKKQLQLEINLEELQIIADEDMLRHLWVNILGNAVKFTPNNGTIGVCLKQEHDKAVIDISDTGIGIDDEVKSRIFEKFYQSDRSRATEGSGLGLSLVQKILELEGGEIQVHSETGKGSCFTIYLPT